MSRLRYLAILSLVGSVLVVVGELLGNVVANLIPIPTTWHGNEPLAFVLITLLFVSVWWWLSRLQESRRRSSRRQRHWATVLLVAYGLVAAGDGLAANLAATSLTFRLGVWAYPLFAAITVLAIAVSVSVSWVQNKPYVEATNRRRFLNQLQDRYRRQRDDALREAAFLVLDLQPDVASMPSTLVAEATQDARQWPEGSTIVQVFDTLDGRLLLLGIPGAGKTTLLVELGEQLVTRARADSTHPMPVIFNLSSWANDRDPLDKWMVEELAQSYQVPRAQGKQWVEGQSILPLLDGLDEVDEQARGACVEAINCYHADHPQALLVVCSREAEYRAQTTMLELTSVYVLPLTPQQVRTFLTDGGETMEGLRQAVDADENLLDVLRTPLFLNLVTVTYQNLRQNSLPPVTDRAAWNQQLFADYVERVLAPDHQRQLETVPPDYMPEQTTGYLVWLAWQLREHGEAEFYLERLQPDWLPTDRRRIPYGSGTRLLVTLLLRMVHWLCMTILIGLAAGFGAWLLAGLFFGARMGYIAGGVVVECVGLPLGFVLLVVEIAMAREERDTISLTEDLRWSWPGFRRGLALGLVGVAMVWGMVLDLPINISALSSRISSYVSNWNIIAGVLALLGAVPAVGLIAGFISAPSSTRMDPRDFIQPNEGFQRSLKHGQTLMLFAGLSTWLVCGMIAGLMMGINSGHTFDLFTGLAYGIGAGIIMGMPPGLSAGLLGWLGGGGSSVIKYGVLRWQLQRVGVVPPHFVRFLNYAAGHTLLQRVGGGYRFIHPLLRDYFADLHTLPSEEHTRAMSH